ncbi:MAG: hypothetical protein ACLQVN_17285 [Bryobacteraceae bacterium]
MPGSALVNILIVVSAAGSLATAIKLFWTGLFRRYRFFVAYILLLVADGVIPFVLDYRSKLYLHVFLVEEVISWILLALTLLELYRLVLERHKGLYTLGRWAMYFALAISILVSILSLLPKIRPSMGYEDRLLGYTVGVERGIYLSLATFLILILLFLTRYPVPLSRNVIVHAAIFSLYFVSNTLILLARALFGLRFNGTANTFLFAISVLCVYAWLLLLSPHGEEVRVQLPRFGPEHEERILRQLDSINATLLRVSRESN